MDVDRNLGVHYHNLEPDGCERCRYYFRCMINIVL